jgi:hypothetical protein
MGASFWWVNHPQSSRAEIEGSYLWFAEKARKSKARSESEKNIQRLTPADVVLSCVDGVMGAVGVVLGPAREASGPAESGAEAVGAESASGWTVPVQFMLLPSPLRMADHMARLAQVLPRKHSPILTNGASNQHMALAAVPPAMQSAVAGLLAGELERIVGTITEAAGRKLVEDAVEATIQRRTDIEPAHKVELLKARNGQGSYRANLEQYENACRLTRVLDRRHLVAVHIKPWSDCDDAEMLDGCNGLLMSPHVAHLFERGYISFTDDGQVLVSQELNPVVPGNWQIDLSANVGEFRPGQSQYLEFHRREVFQQHGAGRRRKPTHEADVQPSAPFAEPTGIEPA